MALYVTRVHTEVGGAIQGDLEDRRRRVGLCGENFRKISMGTEKGTGFFV